MGLRQQNRQSAPKIRNKKYDIIGECKKSRLNPHACLRLDSIGLLRVGKCKFDYDMLLAVHRHAAHQLLQLGFFQVVELEERPDFFLGQLLLFTLGFRNLQAFELRLVLFLLPAELMREIGKFLFADCAGDFIFICGQPGTAGLLQILLQLAAKRFGTCFLPLHFHLAAGKLFWVDCPLCQISQSVQHRLQHHILPNAVGGALT